MECRFCKETEFDKVRKIIIQFQRENPKAHGYPEIVYWKNEYVVEVCPMCGRKVGE